MKSKMLVAFGLLALLSFTRKNDVFFGGKPLAEFEKSFSEIPAGAFAFTTDGRNKERVEVPSFLLSNHEVTNLEYREFLIRLRSSDEALYNQMLPDTMVWRMPGIFNEPLVSFYFRHPAYNEYPVVGVSHSQAKRYCVWLTEHYSHQEDRKYKNAVIQLPTADEWTFAAAGGEIDAKFPFKHPDFENEKGEWVANFRPVDQADIKKETTTVVESDGDSKTEERLMVLRNDKQSSPAAIELTTPVYSYKPNAYGLYNMAGNVEEMMSEYGITKGGSWLDTGFYLQISAEEHYDKSRETSAERGFRVMMRVAE